MSIVGGVVLTVTAFGRVLVLAVDLYCSRVHFHALLVPEATRGGDSDGGDEIEQSCRCGRRLRVTRMPVFWRVSMRAFTHMCVFGAIVGSSELGLSKFSLNLVV
jgi:hypothetical protein